MIDSLVGLGWNKDLATFVALLLGAIAICVFGTVWIIFAIWLERKVAGRIQDRLGPNRVGPYGLLQTFPDIIKLLIKEDITPAGADHHVYNLAPILAFGSILLIWAVVPFNHTWVGANLNVGALYFVAVSSFGTLSILLAGWGSNNKFALLGAFRVIAQLISYEIPMILAIAVPVLLSGTMSVQGIVEKQSIAYIFVAPISAFIFFISQLAEVGRSPFDLVEAESEIVAGFNIEYTGMKFAMFFAGEFLHAFTICVMTAILFMGGWQGLNAGQPGYEILGFIMLMTKTMLVYFLVMLLRVTPPRIRIDQVMAFNWKFLVPLSLVNVIVVAFFAKLFVPDYVGAQAAVDAGGLTGILGGIFGAGFVAELPRAVVLFISNIALWWGANSLLHRYTNQERHKVNLLATQEMKRVEPTSVPAGR
jgi:NADH-quinone oxidoreductase subunit H